MQKKIPLDKLKSKLSSIFVIVLRGGYKIFIILGEKNKSSDSFL